MIKIIASETNKIKTLPFIEGDGLIQSSRLPVQLQVESSTLLTVKDIKGVRNLGGNYTERLTLIPSSSQRISAVEGNDIAYDSDTNIVTLTGDALTGNSTITATVEYKSRSGRFKQDERLHTFFAGDSFIFNDWAEGSLARAIHTSLVASAAAGAGVNDARKYLFTSASPFSGTRNPDLWVDDDFTGVSPRNSRGNNYFTGTAITRRHVVLAAHFPVQTGDVLYFYTQAGLEVARTVIGVSNSYGTDILIACLSSDLPDTIASYNIPPSNLDSYLPSTNWYVPVVWVNQQRKLLLGYLSYIANTSTVVSGLTASIKPPKEPIEQQGFPNAELEGNVITGDSGNPALLIVPGVPPTVIMCWSSQFSGPSLHANKATVDALILSADADAGISTGYTATVADFSMYPTY